MKIETSQELQDKIEAIREVQEQLQEMIGTLRELAHRDEWAIQYIVAPMECKISSTHNWISRDQNIDDWITNLENQIAEINEDEADEDEDETE